MAGQSRSRIIFFYSQLRSCSLELTILVQGRPGVLVMATVIVGAGIIGTSTAYYLSQEISDASAIHLIEASPDLFASASGYAAGFLACDWFSRPLAALGEKSFNLHKELAATNDGFHKWGYSETTSTSLAETIGNHSGADWLREGASRAEAAARTSPASGHFPSWLKSKGELDVMSDGSTTAQVYVDDQQQI